MQSGIYKISSILFPEKVYIGSTVNLSKRRAKHWRSLFKNNHHNINLSNHCREYGLTDLEFLVIERCNIDQLPAKEQFYIDTLNPVFNVCRIANQTRAGRRKYNPLPMPIGVTLSPRGRYRARVKHNYKLLCAGSYNTPQEAHNARTSLMLSLGIDVNTPFSYIIPPSSSIPPIRPHSKQAKRALYTQRPPILIRLVFN